MHRPKKKQQKNKRTKMWAGKWLTETKRGVNNDSDDGDAQKQ